MAHSIEDLPSPDVADLVERTRMAVLPFGSIEQHGPHLPCGTDTYASNLVAENVAHRLDALLVPVTPYGVTPIHAGHPGTISLPRNAFEEVLRAVIRELIDMRVRDIVFVNWHEGNIASLDAVATETQQGNPHVTVVAAQACYVAQRLYRDAGGELSHGGGIETLAVMASDRSRPRFDRVGEPSRPSGAVEMDEMRRSREVYGYITDVSVLAEEGWYGDPAWATPERARTFTDTLGEAVTAQVSAVLSAQRTNRTAR